MRSAPTLALLALGLALAPSLAFAQGARRWAFSAEIGAGTMLHDFDHAELSLATPAVTVTPRFNLRIINGLSVQVGATYGRFVRDLRSIPVGGAMAGLRFEPQIGRIGRFHVDADGGIFLPGTVARPGLDVGVGFDFRITDNLSVGPFARFTHVWDGREGYATLNLAYTPQAGQDTNDIHWWVAGVAFSLHYRPKPPPPPDADHDTIPDANDLCPSVARGDHPDAARPGCPALDTDGDGLYDADDRCPTQSAGANPFPGRPGCPRTDGDGDRVFDDEDQCPTQPAGERPDASRRGCPVADADHDGVADADDACPEAAAGEHPDPSRQGCPAPDGDHDGVFDHADQCPTEAAGTLPDASRAGCPTPDRDHDTIPDASDRCPDQAGVASTNAARNGCPVPPPRRRAPR
jgi:hypothetical protein